MDIVCGIYKITSPSGKIYIGQSIDIHNRWNGYKKMYCKKQVKLYRSLVKHGVCSHFFEIICECLPQELNAFEIHYEKLFDSTNKKTGLNLRGCGSGGLMSEESKIKMSTSRTGVKLSEDHKNKIRKSHFGIRPSEVTRQKMRENSTGNKNCLGLKVPEEVKKKISFKLMGRKLTSDVILNAINGRKGYRHSQETIKKITETNKGHKRTYEERKNISIAHIGLKQTYETIEKRAIKKRKLVLNTKTGVFYLGVKEAANCSDMNISTLSSKLNGNMKNNTAFIYA